MLQNTRLMKVSAFMKQWLVRRIIKCARLHTAKTASCKGKLFLQLKLNISMSNPTELKSGTSVGEREIE